MNKVKPFFRVEIAASERKVLILVKYVTKFFLSLPKTNQILGKAT